MYVHVYTRWSGFQMYRARAPRFRAQHANRLGSCRVADGVADQSVGPDPARGRPCPSQAHTPRRGRRTCRNRRWLQRRAEPGRAAGGRPRCGVVGAWPYSRSRPTVPLGNRTASRLPYNVPLKHMQGSSTGFKLHQSIRVSPLGWESQPML